MAKRVSLCASVCVWNRERVRVREQKNAVINMAKKYTKLKWDWGKENLYEDKLWVMSEKTNRFNISLDYIKI